MVSLTLDGVRMLQHPIYSQGERAEGTGAAWCQDRDVSGGAEHSPRGWQEQGS